MKYISKKQSLEINALRFFMMLLVIFIHENGATNEKYGQIGCSVNNFAQIAVPFFFIISGFFFFKEDNFIFNDYKHKIKKRFFSLLIPYIFWNLWPVIMITGGNLYSVVFHGKSFDDLIYYINSLWNDGLLRIFWNKIGNLYPYNFPLWYVRELMIMSLFSPIIFFLIRKLNMLYIIVISIIYIFVKLPIIAGLFPSSILFFSIGAYFSINKVNIINFVHNNKYIIIPVSVMLYILSTFFLDNYIKYVVFNIFVISMTMCSFLFMSKFPEKCILIFSNASKSVFFIYGIHITIMTYSYKLLMHIPIISNSDVLLYIINPFITIIIASLLYFVLNRIVPNMMKIICGR